MEKANEIAPRIGLKEFQANPGWLTCFKNRHGINFQKIVGEEASVSSEVEKEWKEVKLPLVYSLVRKHFLNCGTLKIA
mgnify:CR=1 FL=1